MTRQHDVHELEPLLVVDEVAALLAFKPSTVRAYCETGRIPHLRIGGQLRFRRSDLLEWLDQHTRKPRPHRRQENPVAPPPNAAIS